MHYRANSAPLSGGIGFDINCGVRLIRTNLTEGQLRPVQGELASSLYRRVPVGVASRCPVGVTARDLDDVLRLGADWCLREGLAWAEDAAACEEHGRMDADVAFVSEVGTHSDPPTPLLDWLCCFTRRRRCNWKLFYDLFTFLESFIHICRCYFDDNNEHINL